MASYDDGPTPTQDGLTGDFEITVAWQDFVPGKASPFVGPRFQAALFWYDPSGYVNQASAFVGGATGGATVTHGQHFTQFTNNQLNPTPTVESLMGASGSFRIQRNNNEMTVVATINGQVVSAQSTEPFPEQPLTLTLSMRDNSDQSMTLDSGVKITQVTVVGGGGAVRSDNFSCP